MIGTFAAKAGAFALAPFLAFGAHGGAHLENNGQAKADARFSAAATVRAQDNDNGSSDLVCTELEHTLYFGSRDSRTEGEVTELQAFLNAEGYLKDEPTGFFGLATARAVRDFQKDAGLSASGFVGAQTRVAIEDASCEEDNEDLAITEITGPTALALDAEGTWTVDVNTDPDAGNLSYSVKWGDEGLMARMMGGDEDIQTSATFTHVYTDEGTYAPEFTVTDGDGNTVTKVAAKVVVSDDAVELPTITAVSHAEAYAGATVTLTGTNFTEDSAVYAGSTELDATYVSDTSLTFVVPTSLALGDYDITVRNGSDVSNSIDFTVIKKAVSRISISGIDAPVSLSTDEEGTWTVNADTNATGNLKYSVEWGDEGMMARLMGSADAKVQTSSTFTHSYSSAGTYKPKFTITDETGARSSVSATVVVTDDSNDE